MFYAELETTVFSLIKENDPYRETKEIQLKNWCRAFLILFSSAGQQYLSFFLDILSDENCWEQTNTIHCIKLNRRTLAKKMVELHSWKGKPNPLDDISRFQVACWCCLEGDIFNLFERFKQQYKIRNDDSVSLKRLVKTLTTGTWSDPLTGFWSHIMGDCAMDIPLEDKHPYEYGIFNALRMYRKHAHIYAGYVEAVEFFWKKIRSLHESELNFQEKTQIFMETTVRAASQYCCDQPEIFEFCISELSFDLYPEFLKREISINHYYRSLSLLHKMLCFDRFKILFECFEPDDISEDMYRMFLTSFIADRYSQYYKNKAVELFLHIWRKEGFDMHRAFVLRKELSEVAERGTLLLTLVKKNYMELVWAVLDEASPYQINELMKSKEACYIRAALEISEDIDSLNKFLSYRIPINELSILNMNQVNFINAHVVNYAE